MKYALIGITMVVALFLIIVVVAQESKQPGMGSAIGGGAEGMIGGKSRGKDAVLSKFTVIRRALSCARAVYEYVLMRILGLARGKPFLLKETGNGR